MHQFSGDLENRHPDGDLEKYFQEKAVPKLKELEEFRLSQLGKVLFRRKFFYAALAVLGVSIFYLSLFYQAFAILLLITMWLPIALVLLILWVWSDYPTRQYKKTSKQHLIRCFLDFMGPNFKHSGMQVLDSRLINDSGVYSQASGILALDRVVGVYKKIDLSLSQVLLFVERQDLSSFKLKEAEDNMASFANYAFLGSMLAGKQGFGKGFAGMVLDAEVHKRFKARIAIRSKSWDRDWRTMDMEPVELESLEFGRRFKIQSNDQIEARYILTPDIMHNLMVLEDLVGGRFSMAFHGQSVIIAIPDATDVFHSAPMNQSVYDTERIKKLFETVFLFISVIDHLKLDHAIEMNESGR